MLNDYKFEGWMAFDQDSIQGKMVWQPYEPKPFEKTDVDIKVTHCGICGSDNTTFAQAGDQQTIRLLLVTNWWATPTE